MVGEQEARISLAASLCALQTLSWPSASPSSKGKQHALNEDRQGEEGSQALEPEEYSRLSYTWQDLLKAILRIDGAILPLSVFLFLLDSLALLRALSANSNNATFSNNDNNDNGSSEEHQYDSFEPDEIVRMLIYIRELVSSSLWLSCFRGCYNYSPSYSSHSTISQCRPATISADVTEPSPSQLVVHTTLARQQCN